jgi:transposase
MREQSNNNNAGADKTIIVGFDVHKDSIVACVFDPSSGEILLEQQLKNQPVGVVKIIKRIRARFGEPRCCYEASSCGFVLYRQLRDLGVECDVIAPSSIPRRSGDRIKTDRRDAEKLATMYAGKLLTAVTVPDPELESTRALLRCRGALVEEMTRTKHRTTQFLQTRGFVYREGTNWSLKFWRWLNNVELERVDQSVLDTYVHLIRYLEAQIASIEADLKEEAKKDRFSNPVAVLGAFRGIALLSALTLVCELGDIRRFACPRQIMSYLGVVPGEHSSANSTKRGSITKSGNTHARKVLISAAWKYALRPAAGSVLKGRQDGVSAEVIAISWKAQKRLYKRFHALAVRKPRSVAAVAVARELTGFLWEAMQTLPLEGTIPGIHTPVKRNLAA